MPFATLGAYRDLLGRYSSVWRQSWKVRHELEPKRRSLDEIAFLPAHLELIETPPHPAPRWTARIIAVIGAALVALGVFGHLDIVAVAPGKLIPNARVKVLQPAVTGVVRSILIRDGMRVQAGQLLMELDPTQAQADTSKALSARLDAQLTVARAQALLLVQRSGHPPQVAPVLDAPSEIAQGAAALDVPF